MIFNLLYFLESLLFVFRFVRKLSICSVFLFIFVLLFCEFIKIRLGIIGLKVFKIGKCVILFDVVFLWVVNFDCLWVLKFECFWIVGL